MNNRELGTGNRERMSFRAVRRGIFSVLNDSARSGRRRGGINPSTQHERLSIRPVFGSRAFAAGGY